MRANKIYILTNENFHQEVLLSKQLALVEFSADWCGTSYIIAPILDDMIIKFKDHIKFCKVDIEDYKELAKQYGIQKIPTILLFKNGRIIDCIVGLVARETLEKKLAILTLKGKETK